MKPSSQFPDDLWVQVLEHFDRKLDQPTIHALRLTSRRVYRLADLFVYRTMVDDFSQKPLTAEGAKSPGPLRRLAWDVARKPQLARLVKEIRLPCNSIGQEMLGPCPVDDNGVKMLDRYDEILRKVELPTAFRNELLEALKIEAALSHLCFLMVVCTSLEILEVRQNPNGTAALIWKTVSCAVDLMRHRQASILQDVPEQAEPPLGSLKKVSIGSPNCGFMSLASLIPFLNLPKIQTVEVQDLGDAAMGQHTIPPPIATKNSSSIQQPISFLLQDCKITGAGLAWLLSCCKSACSLTGRWHKNINNKHLSNKELGDAIRQEGSSLEFIHLDTTDLDEHCYERTPTSLGDFSSLPMLKTLVVSD
ncbi:MAG: hypothetical protein M1821_000483 [Bathelium mastoideum]|nr:MAG: hypothetical protein M1821_000483 [Bathelium mastoideum]